MDALLNATPSHREDGITGLVRSFVDLKTLSAEREHLGHERHAIELPFEIERLQYFVLASDLYPVSDLQLSHHVPYSLIEVIKCKYTQLLLCSE